MISNIQIKVKESSLFNELPDEIIIHIISFFTHLQKCSEKEINLLLVNKRFKDLTYRYQFIRQLADFISYPSLYFKMVKKLELPSDFSTITFIDGLAELLISEKRSNSFDVDAVILNKILKNFLIYTSDELKHKIHNKAEELINLLLTKYAFQVYRTGKVINEICLVFKNLIDVFDFFNRENNWKNIDLAITCIKKYPRGVLSERPLSLMQHLKLEYKEIINFISEKQIKLEEAKLLKVIELSKCIGCHKNRDDIEVLVKFHIQEKEFVKKALEYNEEIFFFLNGKWRKDREIALIAVKQNGALLRELNDAFRNDDEIVMCAIQQSGLAYEYASKRLKKKESFIEEAIKQNSWSFQYLPLEMKDNKKLISMALERNGSVIQHLKSTSKVDIDNIYIALKQDPNAILFIPEEKKDDTVSQLAIKGNPSTIRFLPQSKKNDIPTVLSAVIKDGMVLQLLSGELQDNIDVVLTAVSQNGLALKFASKRLCKNKSVVEAAIKSNWISFYFADQELKKDYDLALYAIHTNKNSISWVDQSLVENSQFMLEAIGICPSLVWKASKALLKNEIFLRNVLNTSINLCNDVYFVSYAGTYIQNIFRYVTKGLLENNLFIWNVLKNNPSALKYAPQECKENMQLVHVAVSVDSKAIEYASEDIKKIYHLVGHEKFLTGEF